MIGMLNTEDKKYLKFVEKQLYGLYLTHCTKYIQNFNTID